MRGNAFRSSTYLAICVALGLNLSTVGAGPIDIDFRLEASMPREVVSLLIGADQLDPYKLDSWINPFYLQADFNGDNTKDVAVWLRERASNKAGILIVHGGSNETFVLGAGFTLGKGGDDFAWLGEWRIYPQGPVIQGPFNQTKPPHLVGDALYVAKQESASGLIYWSGSDYHWYQRGD